MKKEIGKLYICGSTVVLCTGEDKGNRFPGVIVENTSKYPPDQFNRVGHYSNEFVSYSFQEEHTGIVVIDNSNWQPFVEVGCSPG
jgi:hypothetical protein